MKFAGFERSALQQLEHLPHRWLVKHLFMEDDAG